MAFVAILALAGVSIWFGRRLGPALVAVLFVLVAPLWLIVGAAWDGLRKATSWCRPKKPD